VGVGEEASQHRCIGRQPSWGSAVRRPTGFASTKDSINIGGAARNTAWWRAR
jgi:hypothetical protein